MEPSIAPSIRSTGTCHERVTGPRQASQADFGNCCRVHLLQSNCAHRARSHHRIGGWQSGGGRASTGASTGKARARCSRAPVARQGHLICLVCGKKQRTLKRHLAVRHQLTPDEYRERFGLRSEYPMVAPSYAAAAFQRWLGRPGWGRSLPRQRQPQRRWHRRAARPGSNAQLAGAPNQGCSAAQAATNHPEGVTRSDRNRGDKIRRRLTARGAHMRGSPRRCRPNRFEGRLRRRTSSRSARVRTAQTQPPSPQSRPRSRQSARSTSSSQASGCLARQAP